MRVLGILGEIALLWTQQAIDAVDEFTLRWSLRVGRYFNLHLYTRKEIEMLDNEIILTMIWIGVMLNGVMLSLCYFAESS